MRSFWLAAAFLFVLLGCGGKVGYDRWLASRAIQETSARERQRDAALDQLVEMQFGEPVTLQAWLAEFTRQTKLAVHFHDVDFDSEDAVSTAANHKLKLDLPRQTARQALFHLSDYERLHWNVSPDLSIELYSSAKAAPVEAWAHAIPIQFHSPVFQRRDVNGVWYRNTAEDQLAALIENRWADHGSLNPFHRRPPVEALRGQLIVTQSFDAQLQVRQFLRTLAAKLQTIAETPKHGLAPDDPRLAPLWIEPAAPPPALIAERLARRMSLDVTDEPLHHVIGRIAEVTGLRIVLTKQIEDAGCHPDMPVTLRLQNVSARTMLERLLGERNLFFAVKDYVPELQVTTILDDWETDRLTILAYPVADLLDPHGQSTPLHALLDSLVAPDTWNDVGGPGVLCDLGNTLLIAQGNHVHADLQRLLAALRMVKSGQSRRMRVRGTSPEQDRVIKLLQQRRPLKFMDTPLVEVLRALERENGLSIHLTKKIEDAGVLPNTPVTCDLPEAPLAENLARLLQSLNLTYLVKDELVRITTIEDAQSPRSIEIEVFDIRPILKKCFDSEVQELIAFGVHPASWDQTVPQEFQGMLVVQQRHDVLEQVSYVLRVIDRELLAGDAIRTENLLPDLPFAWQDPPRTVMYDVHDLIPPQEIFAGKSLIETLHDWPGDTAGLLNESTAPLHVSLRRFLVAYLEPEQIKILEERLRSMRLERKASGPDK